MTFPRPAALLGGLVLLVGACSGDGGSSTDTPDDTDDPGLFDPYESLRATVPANGIRCDEEACCWDDCQYEQIVCGHQSGTFPSVGSTLDGYDLSTTPDWWRAKRFFLSSNYEMNVLSGRNDSDEPGIYYVGAYCESVSSHTSYTIYTAFDGPQAFETFLAEGVPDHDCDFALSMCQGACSPDCGGRDCGSDGCGGTCGTCGGSESCSSSGQCESGGAANACDECLSVCSGLPGCCTGCGCMCEDDCGGCF